MADIGTIRRVTLGVNIRFSDMLRNILFNLVEEKQLMNAYFESNFKLQTLGSQSISWDYVLSNCRYLQNDEERLRKGCFMQAIKSVFPGAKCNKYSPCLVV